MLAYLIIFFLLLSFVLLSVNASKRAKNVLCLLGAFIVILFQALRWENGTDWDVYYQMFNDFGVSSPDSIIEIGWFELNSIFYNYTGSYTLFLFFQCFVIQYCFLKFAEQMGIDNRAVFVLSVFSASIFPVRMNMALGLIALSYQYIIQRKFPRFILFVLIAASIHTSALFFIPFYFVGKKQLQTSAIIVIYLLFSIVSLASFFVQSNMLSLLSLVNAYISIGVEDKIENYIIYGQSADYINWSSSYYVLAFLRGLLFLYIYTSIRKKYFNNSDTFNTLLNLYVVGLCVVRTFAIAIPYFARLGNFATIGGDVMLMLGIQKCKKNNQFLYLACYGVYLLYGYLSILNGQYKNLFIPYNLVF